MNGKREKAKGKRMGFPQIVDTTKKALNCKIGGVYGSKNQKEVQQRIQRRCS